MTKDEAKQAIEVMQAYVDGKAIQISDSEGNNWIGFLGEPYFDWLNANYRIKPEPKYIPFTFEDSRYLLGNPVMSVSKFNSFNVLIIQCESDRVIIGNGYSLSYKDLLIHYQFLDGSPCGKLTQ